MERWKLYLGEYEISDHGNMRRRGRLLKPALHSTGCLEFVMTFHYKSKHVRAHRAVAEAFIPNPQGLPEVNHINGNRHDNRVENLEWCTGAYNREHAQKTLGFRPGVDVSCPCRCVETGELYQSRVEAARAIGVTPAAITHVLHGRCKTVKGLHWETAPRLPKDQRATWHTPNQKDKQCK